MFLSHFWSFNYILILLYWYVYYYCYYWSTVYLHVSLLTGDMWSSNSAKIMLTSLDTWNIHCVLVFVMLQLHISCDNSCFIILLYIFIWVCVLYVCVYVCIWWHCLVACFAMSAMFGVVACVSTESSFRFTCHVVWTVRFSQTAAEWFGGDELSSANNHTGSVILCFSTHLLVYSRAAEIND